MPFGIDILGKILITLFSGIVPTDQIGKTIMYSAQYMLPDPAPLLPGGEWFWLPAALGALGATVAAGLFAFATIIAGSLGDARRLIQAVGGVTVSFVAGPAAMYVYGVLRDPMLASANAVAGQAAKTLAGDALTSTVAQGVLSLLAMVIGVVGMTIAAGILGFAVILTLLLTPLVTALAVFRAGVGVAVRWAVTLVGLMFAPLIASVGLAITAIIVAGASWSATSWVVAGTGMLMSGAAPFIVLARLQTLGLPDLAAGRGQGGGRAAASAAQTARLVVK